MFDHIGIFVSDPLRSIPFYERCLAPLGITIVQRQPEWSGVQSSSPARPNSPFFGSDPLEATTRMRFSTIANNRQPW